VEMRNFVVI